MYGPATPADISLRIWFTCRRERQLTHHRRAEWMVSLRQLSLPHWRLSRWAGFTRLGVITDVHLLSSSGSLAIIRRNTARLVFGQQSAGLFYACGYHLPQRSVVRIRRCALLATASAHSNAVEVFWIEPWTDLRKMFRDHVEVFLPLSE